MKILKGLTLLSMNMIKVLMSWTNPLVQRWSSHWVFMVTLVTLVIIVPTPRGVSNPTSLILCLVDIIPRVNQTCISIMLIPLRSVFLLFSHKRVAFSRFGLNLVKMPVRYPWEWGPLKGSSYHGCLQILYRWFRSEILLLKII